MLLPLYAIATNGVVGGEAERLPLLTKISEQKLMNGEHAPLTFTGTDTVSAAGDSVMTRWMQLGTARGSSVYDNELPQTFNPEIFTLTIELDTCAGGDSIGLAKALFEVCFDTSETDLQTLTLSHIDTSFTVGETVTGSGSGATGVIASKTVGVAGDTILFLHSVEGVFDSTGAKDYITGATSGARDSLAFKTTLKHMAARNNDGSSIFCVDGALTNFATWVSEEISITSDVKNVQKYVFPLRVLTPGAYIRFQYTSAVLGLADDVKIHWELKCEH